ncbi:unnamed protein product [Periconia digitata]|uniref:Uncharacterized protein n=1 Tax=Periconia digitata TaxID=1303443 RepID=A0A9W4UBZ7_9PLEO|nr:unnamed protein product [Periconia digitata]
MAIVVWPFLTSTIDASQPILSVPYPHPIIHTEVVTCAEALAARARMVSLVVKYIVYTNVIAIQPGPSKEFHRTLPNKAFAKVSKPLPVPLWGPKSTAPCHVNILRGATAIHPTSLGTRHVDLENLGACGVAMCPSQVFFSWLAC